MSSRSLVVALFLPLLVVAGTGCKSTDNGDPKTPSGQPDPTMSEPPGGTGNLHKPPQEAFDACKGKKADDPCTWTRESKDHNGTCHARPNEADLVCHGERHRGGPGGDQSGGTPK